MFKSILRFTSSNLTRFNFLITPDVDVTFGFSATRIHIWSGVVASVVRTIAPIGSHAVSEAAIGNVVTAEIKRGDW